MKYFILFLSLFSFSAISSDLNELITEYIVAIDGVEKKFQDGDKKKFEVNGKDVDVSFKLGEYKSFNNYGVSFKVPVKTSAYLDESDNDLDIWNFDFHDSVFMLIVLKNSDFEISDASLTAQMTAIATSMNSAVSEVQTYSLNENKVKAVSALGNLGKHEFLIEQFGFAAGESKILAFTYYPLIDRKTRDVQKIYKDFKNTIFSTLEF